MKDFNEVVEQINGIVDWYRELPMDYTGINDLMYQRIQLVTLLSYYATELGECRIEFKNSEAQTERAKREHTKKYLDAGFPMSKASELGKFYSLDNYEDEKRWDGLFNSMRLFYDNTNSIIDTMNQHISNLKREEQYQKNTGQT
tara:strand:+ start:1106 stop:1537 length:432 start_codon:yes stop_codon:yes gene_type:complete